MIKLPGDERQWKVSMASDLFGHIQNARNLDFNESGYLKLARKANAIYTSDTDADLGQIVAIPADATNYYIVTDDGTFIMTGTTNLSFTQLTSTNAPTSAAGSDGIIYDNLLHVSGTTKVGSYSAGAWTDRVTGLNSAYPHPLCVDTRRREFAVGNGNVMTTYTDASPTPVNTLTIREEYIIESIRYQSGNYYIGTRDVTGGDAPVYVWNGTGTAATSYPSGSDWVYAIANYEPSVVILTSSGQLKRWNGGGFDVMPGGTLPVYNTNASWSENASNSSQGKCLNRGMIAIGSRIYLNINGATETPIAQPPGPGLVNQPSGLWVYEPSVGLYHKAGYANQRYSTISITSINSSIVKMASAHGIETGDVVLATSVSNVPALSAGGMYFAIKENTTDLKLALSQADAVAGRYIEVSGTVSGDSLGFQSQGTFGNTYNTDPGAVSGFTRNKLSLFHGSEVLFGGTSQDADANSVSALQSLAFARNRGWFITTRLLSGGIQDIWNTLYAKLKRLNLDTDAITIKYRIVDKFGLPTPVRNNVSNGLITWVTSTTFTIDTRYKDVRSASVGDEVYFIEGAGAGWSTQISAIDDTSSTYTYTIEDAISGVGAGDKSEAYIDNWTPLVSTITDGTETLPKGYIQVPIDQTSAWIELKIEMKAFDINIDTLKIINAIVKDNN